MTIGVFSRRVDNLELYRVQDLFLYKPFPLWLLGYGYVKVITTDKTDPEMTIGIVKHPTALYQLLRQYTEHTRCRLGVREMEVDAK